MQTKWIKSVLIIGAFGLVLTGCASKAPHTKMTAGPVYSQPQVVTDTTSTQGMGKEASFDEGTPADTVYDSNEAYTPHKDVYHFHFDSSAITDEDMGRIKQAAHFLAAHPKARVLLEGNTDERGSREYNIALGERRAKSVAEVMQLSGANNNQIRLVSYGQEKPVSLGHEEGAWGQNRRVELSFEVSN